jgi:hypothetical protein
MADFTCNKRANKLEMPAQTQSAIIYFPVIFNSALDSFTSGFKNQLQWKKITPK